MLRIEFNSDLGSNPARSILQFCKYCTYSLQCLHTFCLLLKLLRTLKVFKSIALDSEFIKEPKLQQLPELIRFLE